MVCPFTQHCVHYHIVDSAETETSLFHYLNKMCIHTFFLILDKSFAFTRTAFLRVNFGYNILVLVKLCRYNLELFGLVV